MVPAGPRAGWVGRCGAHALVEHAAGAEGGLRQAGAGASLADERGLLVAGHAGDRPAAGQDGRPRRAARASRRWWGGRASGMRRRRQHLGVPSRPVAVDKPGDPGVGGVGDVQRSRPTGSRPPRCRRCRRPARRPRPGAVRVGHVEDGRQLGGRGVGGHPDPLGPGARGRCPTVRRSCQPMPGRHGTPGGPVPHDGRGPLVGDADRLAPGRRRPGSARPPPARPRPWPRRRTRPAPGRRVSGSTGDVVDVVDRGRRAARPRPAPRRCRRRRPGCSLATATGRRRATGRPSLPGLRMPRGSSASLTEASTSKPDRARRAGSGPG